MTGPLRTKPMVDLGEDAQFSEPAGEPLAWQRELDVAIADIDSRLTHPPPARHRHPAGGAADRTAGSHVPEAIEEIARRVAELLRGNAGPVQPGAMAEAISSVAAAPKRAARSTPPPPVLSRSPSDWRAASCSIRIRRPFFRGLFRRRYRKQRMITFSDYRIT